MKQNTLVTYALIGIAAYFLLRDAGSAFAAKFTVANPRLRFRRLTPTGADVSLSLNIRNNSAVSIPVDDIDVQIYYMNDMIATTTLTQPVNVSGNSETPVTLNVFIPYLGLSSSLIELIKTGTLDRNIVATGQVTSAGVVVPFTQTIQIV